MTKRLAKGAYRPTTVPQNGSPTKGAHFLYKGAASIRAVKNGVYTRQELERVWQELHLLHPFYGNNGNWRILFQCLWIGGAGGLKIVFFLLTYALVLNSLCICIKIHVQINLSQSPSFASGNYHSSQKQHSTSNDFIGVLTGVLITKIFGKSFIIPLFRKWQWPFFLQIGWFWPRVWCDIKAAVRLASEHTHTTGFLTVYKVTTISLLFLTLLYLFHRLVLAAFVGVVIVVCRCCYCCLLVLLLLFRRLWLPLRNNKTLSFCFIVAV